MQRHGQIQHFLEWGSRHGDYNCLSAGLAKAGRLDLLPPKPRTAERPLFWWNTARQMTTLAPLKISLRLGDLYEVVFPYNSRLRRNWHHAGADVQMTAHLIEEYFRRSQGTISQRTLDFYFSGPNPAIREPTSVSERRLELEDDDLTSMIDERDAEWALKVTLTVMSAIGMLKVMTLVQRTGKLSKRNFWIPLRTSLTTKQKTMEVKEAKQNYHEW